MRWCLVPFVFLLGCPCTVEDLDRWFYEDWEGCDGLCGWEVVEGGARIVETYHPAEHALQFTGERAAVRHELDPGSRTCADESDCSMEFGAVTDCWDRSGTAHEIRLGVRLVYRDPSGTEVPETVVLECTTAGGTLRYCTGDVALELDDPAGGSAWPLSAVILEGGMDGCIVDDVVLESFWIFCGA